MQSEYHRHVEQQKFFLKRHSRSSDTFLDLLTVISIELTKRQRVPFLTGCKKHRLTRVTPENIGLDRVYIIRVSYRPFSLLPSFYPSRPLSFRFSRRCMVSGLSPCVGITRWQRGKKKRADREKREGHDRRWCAPSTRITGLRRDQDLSFWCWSDGRMDENRPDGSHTPLNWSIRKSWWSLGGSARAFTIDRVRIFILPIFTPRPNSQEYNIRLIRKFRLWISHVYF